MTLAFSVAARPEGYRPGECNIGPAEIAARRRAGHLGVLATVALFAAMVALDADPAWRLLLFIPATGAATGYLQAALRFCAAFGLQGVFNFGDQLRDTTDVADADARAADRRKALRLFGVAALLGLAVAIVALLLPL